jgi:hypothetical protein
MALLLSVELAHMHEEFDFRIAQKITCGSLMSYPCTAMEFIDQF